MKKFMIGNLTILDDDSSEESDIPSKEATTSAESGNHASPVNINSVAINDKNDNKISKKEAEKKIINEIDNCLLKLKKIQDVKGDIPLKGFLFLRKAINNIGCYLFSDKPKVDGQSVESDVLPISTILYAYNKRSGGIWHSGNHMTFIEGTVMVSATQKYVAREKRHGHNGQKYYETVEKEVVTQKPHRVTSEKHNYQIAAEKILQKLKAEDQSVLSDLLDFLPKMQYVFKTELPEARQSAEPNGQKTRVVIQKPDFGIDDDDDDDDDEMLQVLKAKAEATDDSDLVHDQQTTKEAKAEAKKAKAEAKKAKAKAKANEAPLNLTPLSQADLDEMAKTAYNSVKGPEWNIAELIKKELQAFLDNPDMLFEAMNRSELMTNGEVETQMLKHNISMRSQLKDWEKELTDIPTTSNDDETVLKTFWNCLMAKGRRQPIATSFDGRPLLTKEQQFAIAEAQVRKNWSTGNRRTTGLEMDRLRGISTSDDDFLKRLRSSNNNGKFKSNLARIADDIEKARDHFRKVNQPRDPLGSLTTLVNPRRYAAQFNALIPQELKDLGINISVVLMSTPKSALEVKIFFYQKKETPVIRYDAFHEALATWKAIKAEAEAEATKLELKKNDFPALGPSVPPPSIISTGAWGKKATTSIAF